jgi:predicted HAD superfamily Cof-like phosphohydrolase
MLACVRTFHQHVGAPVSDVPRLLECDKESASTLASDIRHLISNRSNTSTDQLTLRTHLALEELAEWLEAHVAGDIIEAADAWADRAYVLFGDAVVSGLPASQLFQEVHRSNMSKSAVGQTGKGKKGASYQPPNIRPLLEH